MGSSSFRGKDDGKVGQTVAVGYLPRDTLPALRGHLHMEPRSFHYFLPITCLLHAIHRAALLWPHPLLHPHGRWIAGKSHQFCSEILSSWAHAIVSVWTSPFLFRGGPALRCTRVTAEVQGVSLAGPLPLYTWVTEGHCWQAARPLPRATTLSSVSVVASCLLYQKGSGNVSLVSDW